MNSLWLETCLGSFFVAVSLEEKGSVRSLSSVFDANPRNANKLLSTSVNQLLESNELKSESIDCIYLSQGPGSFTGIKLAAAFALGFSFAHPRRIPIKGYDALCCLSKMLTKNIILKSTSKTGFYSDGVMTKNILGSEVSSVGGVFFWNEWQDFSDTARTIKTEDKQSIYEKLVDYLQEDNEFSGDFQKANYLKEPEIHSKGRK